jgi:hypothetical protein
VSLNLEQCVPMNVHGDIKNYNLILMTMTDFAITLSSISEVDIFIGFMEFNKNRQLVLSFEFQIKEPKVNSSSLINLFQGLNENGMTMKSFTHSK